MTSTATSVNKSSTAALEKLSALIKNRDRYFSSLQTNFDLAKELEECLKSGKNIDSRTEAVFCLRLKKIDQLLERFETTLCAIDEINQKLEENDRVDTVQSMMSFEELYYICGAVHKRLEDMRGSTASSAAAQDITNSHVRDSTSQVKLPRIKIPEFSGNLDDWSNFHSLFSSLVHNESAYSPCEKFHFLRSLLKDEPLDIIANLEVSDANYYIAWDDLMQRYQSKRILTAHYINSMLNFQPLAHASISNFARFLKVFKSNAAALKAMNIDNLDDVLLLHIAGRNLDSSTRLAFEKKFAEYDTLVHSDLIKFVESQQRVLEITKNSPCLGATHRQNRLHLPSASGMKGKQRTSYVSTVSSSHASQNKCPSCFSVDHKLYYCDKFKSLNLQGRIEFINKHKLCSNCLGDHALAACQSKSRCKFCNKNHHRLLHEFSASSRTVDPHLRRPSLSEAISNPVVATSSIHLTSPKNYVLLSTAVVAVSDAKGELKPIRVLIDQGSQVNIMTRECAKKLGLHIRRSHHSMSALGGSLQASEGVVTCTMRPLKSNYPYFDTHAFVINKITDDQPRCVIDPALRERFFHLNLADPNYDTPSPIDFLVGAELFALILGDSYNVIKGEPTALSTCFGWILFGKTPCISSNNSSVNLLSCCDTLNDTLKRFWESESVINEIPPSPEEESCEATFATTHYRLPSGRYVVHLPFRVNPPSLPECRESSLKRFLTFEKRVCRSPELATAYHDFMQEYINLNHMTPAKEQQAYIIPHHVVLKMDSVTTKLRTVFDASFCPFNDGASLNSALINGPKLQRDLPHILTGFRIFRFVVCTDIKQMYRMILIDEAHRKYQHIFYRRSPAEPVVEYELNTVTYGLKPSAFLAQRVLLQLVQDEGACYPLAGEMIKRQCYMDDICAGAHDLTHALRLKGELIELMRRGGFELRKWYSNYEPILEDIPSEYRTGPKSFSPLDDHSTKILGILYDPIEDSFAYSVSLNLVRPTKRGVFSEISKIFDPLGWLTPVTLAAKCLIQRLWRTGLHWDELLTGELLVSWREIVEALPALQSLKISRHVPLMESSENKIYGFCDASEKGYSAVIYVTTRRDNVVKGHLIKGRSKVAPMLPHSIPRMELCGALLLAQTLSSLSDFVLDVKPSAIKLYCDSTIVLAWLRTPPRSLKTFVANRVVEILRLTSPHQWNHITSRENPADPGSRGMLATELMACNLWWDGPKLMYEEESHKSLDDQLPNSEPAYYHELKPSNISLIVTEDPQTYVSLLERYNTLSTAKRVFAFVLRFIKNKFCREGERSLGPLCTSELKKGLFALIRVTQQFYYARDIKLISNSKPPLCKELRKLSAFLDNEGLLRVGGRIDLASAPYNLRHPCIIPQRSRLALLICEYHHLNSFHGGTRLVSSLVQRQYWIPSLRNVIRKCYFRCKSCYLSKTNAHTPLMASLPSVRFENVRAFTNVAIDFAGPFSIKANQRRNASPSKAYLAVFVCLQVKAVHLELAADLSSDSFLRVLDRFVSRRGLCKKIYCDRGTNFVGASRQLDVLYERLSSEQHRIRSFLDAREIVWSFNPAGAPHFNGMAEAGVKSAKFHLNKVLGSQILTYEELYTLIVRVESVLNSRPLGALTADSQDGDYLTPGHFLVGAPLLAVPEEDLTNVAIGRLSRFQLIKQCLQCFWKRWIHEYLPTLIPRTKWTENQENLKKHDVVFIRKEKTAPLNWPIGRIIETFPGKDGVVRVARIQTATGCYVRPVHVLVPLPPAA